MGADTPRPEVPIDWRKVHALGLPSGSVRALLAILIFATVWCSILVQPNREIPDYLGDLLFIIMGHYFAARRRSAAEPEPGPPPLFLPKGSVRLLLLGGSVLVAVLLYQRGQLTPVDRNPGVVTLLLVGGFLLGVALNTVAAWWQDRGHRTPRFLEDLRALVSLAAAIALVFLVLNHFFRFVPPDLIGDFLSQWVHLGRLGPEHILAAIVGFYFGSRS
jgi:hypothetical protein